MKSELKEIQESNLLADKIEAFLVKVKQKLPVIIGVVAVTTVLLLVAGVYKAWTDSISAKGWSSLYFSDTDSSDLESIADDFPKTPAGQWARMMAGDSHLVQGVQSANSNRDIADKHYEKAVAEYQRVASSATEGFLLARANFGLAQAYEGLAKKEDAAASYRKITKLSNIDAEFQAEASKRATWLESTEADEFFAWYKDNRVTSPTIPPMTGDKPSVPSAPAFDLPSAPGAALQTPAPEGVQSSDKVDTPTENKPVDTPAPAETPASALPTSEPPASTPIELPK